MDISRVSCYNSLRVLRNDFSALNCGTHVPIFTHTHHDM